MGDPTGFKEHPRKEIPYRDCAERLLDCDEIFTAADAQLHKQASRCMDCGTPFCQSEEGCPIYNLIPEWNDLVYKGDWQGALDRLHHTNNFPEFTGRVCPAPCEGACVLGITDPSVTIKNIEKAIIDHGFAKGWVVPTPPQVRTNHRVAIVGSGPAGLAAAAQLNKAGHRVTVYERADRVGGLLMYGIPNMKLDKGVVQRRVDILQQEGIEFITDIEVGSGQNGSVDVREVLAQHDALLLATGATVPRDLAIDGRHLKGVHFAMDYLFANTKTLLDSGDTDNAPIHAQGKHVIVIGGGDTGTDCIGTALRHGCRSLVNFEILDKPPAARATDNPWPTWPRIFRVDYGHAEAENLFAKDPRVYQISGKAFIGDDSGQVTGIRTCQIGWESGKPVDIPDSEQVWPADLVLLAMGFLGPEHQISKPIQLELDARSNYQAEYEKYQTNQAKVFVAGDCRRGQSLVVRAINEGRQAAREIDRFLMGSSYLP